MAITLVQSRAGNNTGNGSYSLAFNSNLTAGSASVVVVCSYPSAVAANAVTDTQGNTYTKIAESSANNNWVAVFYALSVSSGANTVSVAANTGTDYLTIGLHEFSGVATASALDQSGTASDNVGSTSVTTATINTANANDVVFAAMTDNTSSGTVTATTTGWTEGAKSTLTTANHLATQYKVMNATGGYAATWTLTSSQKWATVIFGLKEQSSATPVSASFSSPYEATASISTARSTPYAVHGSVSRQLDANIEATSTSNSVVRQLAANYESLHTPGLVFNLREVPFEALSSSGDAEVPLVEQPIFPSAVASEVDLLNVKNAIPSSTPATLSASISSADMTMTLAAGTGSKFPDDSFTVTVDDEIIMVSLRVGDVLTIAQRGAEGTSATGHSLGARVRNTITAKSHNQLVSEVVAIETALGSNLSNIVTSAKINAPNGVAGLDSQGLVPRGKMPTKTVTQVSAGMVVASIWDDVFLITAGSNNFSIVLPDAAQHTGLSATFIRLDAGSGVTSIITSNQQKINGQMAYQLFNQYQRVQVISDGSNWYVVGAN